VIDNLHFPNGIAVSPITAGWRSATARRAGWSTLFATGPTVVFRGQNRTAAPDLPDRQGRHLLSRRRLPGGLHYDVRAISGSPPAGSVASYRSTRAASSSGLSRYRRGRRSGDDNLAFGSQDNKEIL